MSMYLVLKDFTTVTSRFHAGEEHYAEDFVGDILDIDQRVERGFVEMVVEHDPGHEKGTPSRRGQVNRPPFEEARAEGKKEPPKAG